MATSCHGDDTTSKLRLSKEDRQALRTELLICPDEEFLRLAFVALQASQHGVSNLADRGPDRLLGLDGEAVALLGGTHAVAELASVDGGPFAHDQQLSEQAEASLSAEDRGRAIHQLPRQADLTGGICRECQKLGCERIGTVHPEGLTNPSRDPSGGVGWRGEGKDIQRARIRLVAGDLLDGLDDEDLRFCTGVCPPTPQRRPVQKIERQVPVSLPFDVASERHQPRDRIGIARRTVVEDLLQPGHPGNVVGREIQGGVYWWVWQGLRMRCPPPGLRPVRYAYAPPSVEKLLGSLPVVAELCRRLDVAGIVDRACPVREVARVTHGQVIEALVANRLSSPRPLLRVEGWARQWAVEEVFGIAPDALNDDRIGRALDAMAPQLDLVVGSVGARAIAVFGVDVARLHWDMTSISLYGVYEEVETGFAAPKWGKPKDRRPDLKQVQTGLAVSGDGGVPVWHRAFDGGAGEVAQVVGAMEGLKELAGTRKVLLVGDSKLISRGNIQAMNTARVAFIAPAGKTYLPAAQLRALEPAAASPVDYLAERDQDLPPGRRGSYRVVEGGITLKAKRKTEPDLAVRCVFVWSSARAQAAATSRAKKLD